MARSDLLVALVQAGASGDQQKLQATVEEMVAEEKSRHHNVLAERLMRALQDYSEPHRRFGDRRSELVESSSSVRRFIKEIQPRIGLDDLLLSESCRNACQRLITEQLRADVLRSHSLEPQHRVLLVGPPGNGKTSLAEAIAEALSVPLFVIRYDAVVGHYLGETATRLRKVFDYARTTHCVLFFDEFDTLGKERGDENETGEIKRVVSSLLMQMDDLPSYAVVVAASNHAELLDRAVWRRFEIRLELPTPGPKEITEYLQRFFERFREPVGIPFGTIANRLSGDSYAEVADFCRGVLRSHVLAMGEEQLSRILKRQIDDWAERANQFGQLDDPVKLSATG